MRPCFCSATAHVPSEIEYQCRSKRSWSRGAGLRENRASFADHQLEPVDAEIVEASSWSHRRVQNCSFAARVVPDNAGRSSGFFPRSFISKIIPVGSR